MRGWLFLELRFHCAGRGYIRTERLHSSWEEATVFLSTLGIVSSLIRAWLLFQLRFHCACAHREREGEAGESKTDRARERESEREGGESETESARERESERQRERRAMLSGPAGRGLGSAQG